MPECPACLGGPYLNSSGIPQLLMMVGVMHLEEPLETSTRDTGSRYTGFSAFVEAPSPCISVYLRVESWV